MFLIFCCIAVKDSEMLEKGWGKFWEGAVNDMFFYGATDSQVVFFLTSPPNG